MKPQRYKIYLFEIWGRLLYFSWRSLLSLYIFIAFHFITEFRRLWCKIVDPLSLYEWHLPYTSDLCNRKITSRVAHSHWACQFVTAAISSWCISSRQAEDDFPILKTQNLSLALSIGFFARSVLNRASLSSYLLLFPWNSVTSCGKLLFHETPNSTFPGHTTSHAEAGIQWNVDFLISFSQYYLPKLVS